MSKQSEQRGDNTQELNRLHELLIAKLNTKKRMIKPYDERFIIGYQTKKKGDDTDWGYLDEEIMRHVKRFINDWHNKQVEEMEDNLNEIGNKPWRAMRWIAEFLESREGDYNKECAKEYRKLEAFYSNGGFEVIDTLLADETFNLNHPHLIAELREKVGNK